MLLTPLLLLAADRWWRRTSPAGARATDARARRAAERRRSSSPASAATVRSSAGCCSPTAVGDRARPRRRPDRARAPLRLARLLRRRDPARPAAHRRRGHAPACWSSRSTTSSRASKLVDLAREHFPQLTIVARARNVQHCTRCASAASSSIERETFDAALRSGRSVLEALGWQPHQARTLALRFRTHNLELLDADGAALQGRDAADRDRQGGPRSSSRSCGRASARTTRRADRVRHGTNRRGPIAGG